MLRVLILFRTLSTRSLDGLLDTIDCFFEPISLARLLVSEMHDILNLNGEYFLMPFFLPTR